MKIHHLNCGVIQGLHVCGEHLICHCLLIETDNSGLVLVDTGLGEQDLINPVPRFGRAFSYIYAKPKLDTDLAAVSQIKKMGFNPKDVRHIILTHMDLDHVGGLVDFPNAIVHVHKSEFEAAMNKPGFKSKNRYLNPMWAHNPNFITYKEGGEKWFGFDSIQQLKGLPPEILLIPTMGHTRGHTAVAINAGEKWLLHAGDAYFDHREVHEEKRHCSFQLEAFQLLNQTNRRLRLYNQDRLRSLVHDNPGVNVFSAHNPIELKKLILHP